MCVLNGRFNEKKDVFTSVSTKGTAVVDYILCPISNLMTFDNFQVTSNASMVQQFRLGRLLNKHCKAPDHAILSVTFSIVAIMSILLFKIMNYYHSSSSHTEEYRMQWQKGLSSGK